MPIRQIEKLKSGEHAVAPSLYIAVSPTGGRSWVYRHVRNGRKIDMGIGSCRAMSRDDAMREVERLQTQRRAGVDPLAARRRNAAADAVHCHCPTFRQAAIDFRQSRPGTTILDPDRWAAHPRLAMRRGVVARAQRYYRISGQGRATT
jgi:Arm domain-containing DNA-binding protein